MNELIGVVPISFLCQHFGVSRSGFYSWKNHKDSSLKTWRNTLQEEIRRTFDISKGTYGAPRVYQSIKKNIKCSRNTVAKIMATEGLKARIKKRFKVATTDSRHSNPIAPRLFEVEKGDIPPAPNLVWAGDITYIHLKDRFVYLSVVMDLFNRKIIGWSLDDSLNVNGVINAMNKAIISQGSPKTVIYHSDRGVQYSCTSFRELLKKFEITPSMSRKGNCYDNAYVESFFKTLKTELIYMNDFSEKSVLRSELFYYIESWYNRKRIHSSLDYMSPVDYTNATKTA